MIKQKLKKKNQRANRKLSKKILTIALKIAKKWRPSFKGFYFFFSFSLSNFRKMKSFFFFCHPENKIFLEIILMGFANDWRYTITGDSRHYCSHRWTLCMGWIFFRGVRFIHTVFYFIWFLANFSKKNFILYVCS